MWHKNNAIEECCRICHKTSPKSKIKPIKKEHSDYFLIPYHNRERICTDCLQKYDVFKNSPFNEIKINFGYTQHQNVPDVSFCSDQNPCCICNDKENWKEIQKLDKKDRKFREKEFFHQKIRDNCSTVTMTPVTIKDIPQIGFYRVEYRGKKRDFIHCRPCDKLLDYTNSNTKSLTAHATSKEHLDQSTSNILSSPSKRKRTSDSGSSESEKKYITNEQILEIREIVGECYLPKLGAYYCASQEFFEPLLRILAVVNHHMPENRSLVGTRPTLLKFADEKAKKIKEEVINEIAEETAQGTHFVILTDDGSLNHGAKENLRTWSTQYINAAGELNRRYLTSTDEENKSAESLKNSLDNVREEFGINNYSLCTDGASSNLKLAKLDGKDGHNRQLNLCGPHGNNNSAVGAIKETEKEDENFRQLNMHMHDFLSKASRKKFNQKFMSHDGWTKIKGLADTRWDSVAISLKSILKNYDILKEAKIHHPLFDNYSKSILEEYLAMISPMKNANENMQILTKTSGHLVATHFHKLWVTYMRFSVDNSKPPMLRTFAKHLADQFNQRIEIPTPEQAGSRGRKTNRVNLDRVLQSAFYIGNGYLSVFKTKMSIQEHQQSVDDRVEQYESMIKKWADEKSEETFVAESQNLFVNIGLSETPLEFEIKQYINLAHRYVNSKEDSQLPQVLKDFKRDAENKLDANANFWFSEYAKEHLPNLRAQIIKLLPIPASTSMVEGTFSFANQIRTPKRSTLSIKHLNSYLTLRYCRILNSHHSKF